MGRGRQLLAGSPSALLVAQLPRTQKPHILRARVRDWLPSSWQRKGEGERRCAAHLQEGRQMKGISCPDLGP